MGVVWVISLLLSPQREHTVRYQDSYMLSQDVHVVPDVCGGTKEHRALQSVLSDASFFFKYLAGEEKNVVTPVPRLRSGSICVRAEPDSEVGPRLSVILLTDAEGLSELLKKTCPPVCSV